MNEQEMLNMLTEIGTCEDDATRRQMLTELTDGVKGVFGSLSTVTAENETLEKNNKQLQEYNMQLYLRVNDPGKQTQHTKPEPAKELKYENLFNENGGLK